MHALSVCDVRILSIHIYNTLFFYNFPLGLPICIVLRSSMCRTNDVKSRLGVYDNDFEESVSLWKTGNTHPLAGDNYFSSQEQASSVAENVLRPVTAHTTQGDSHHHPHFIPHAAVEAENPLLLHSVDDLKAVPWRANTEGYHSHENDDINENWET